MRRKGGEGKRGGTGGGRGGEGEGAGEGRVSRFARIWGRILTADNWETVRVDPSVWYTFPKSGTPRAIDWNRFRDDRTKDNGVSGLDHVIGQGRMGNYWDRWVVII